METTQPPRALPPSPTSLDHPPQGPHLPTPHPSSCLLPRLTSQLQSQKLLASKIQRPEPRGSEGHLGQGSGQSWTRLRSPDPGPGLAPVTLPLGATRAVPLSRYATPRALLIQAPPPEPSWSRLHPRGPAPSPGPSRSRLHPQSPPGPGSTPRALIVQAPPPWPRLHPQSPPGPGSTPRALIVQAPLPWPRLHPRVQPPGSGVRPTQIRRSLLFQDASRALSACVCENLLTCRLYTVNLTKGRGWIALPPRAASMPSTDMNVKHGVHPLPST